MDNNENRKDLLPTGNESKIQLVVNNNQEDDAIDLGNVFRNMKLKKRIFAWVLVLCMTVGACAPLLLYQFSHSMLTVSSVVTLNYNIPAKNGFVPVTNLTAPDGKELDLNQISSSYVLQSAINGMSLSQPVTVRNLRDNIKIERVLTEDSRRVQEVAAKMVEDKSTSAYTQVQGVKMTYENKFVVSLTNGFGDADSKKLVELTEGELRQLLNRILSTYNDYLVKTYANNKLPDDEFSVIDIEELDVLDSLDLMRTATTNLYNYCKDQQEEIQEYRSWRTGRTLKDWMQTLNLQRSMRINYLYSYVYNNSIVRDRETTITNYQYQYREAQKKLDTVNENIATVKSILDTYKNDEIYVSMQESDASRTTKTTTDYYNNLIMQQANNYQLAAEQEIIIADLTDKLESLNDTEVKRAELVDEISDELKATLQASKTIYSEIKDHMEELQESATYTSYAEYTAAQGKEKGYLASSIKKMVLGVVLGIIIAGGIWFLAALIPEFNKDKRTEQLGKEAMVK